MNERAEQINHEVLRRLTMLRLKKGLTHQHLADLTGLDRSYIGLLEKGKRRPTLEVTLKLSIAMDISLSKLLAEIEKEYDLTEEIPQKKGIERKQSTSAIMLGKAVRQGRRKAGLTQAKLAEKSGLSPIFISQIERGKASLTIDDLTILCKGMSVKLSGLMAILD